MALESDHRGESIHSGRCLARDRQASRHGALELTASGAAGVLWRGTQGNDFTADAQAFVEVDAVYGDPDKGTAEHPTTHSR
jgi:hypothetical protein